MSAKDSFRKKHAPGIVTSFVNKQHLTVYIRLLYYHTFEAIKKTHNLLQRTLSPVVNVETN